MSGTSVDGVDALVLALRDDQLEIIACHDEPYPEPLRLAILSLCQPGINEIDRLGVVDRDVADTFAKAALTVIDQADLKVGDIKAIGSHGQTIRHRPSQDKTFTLQIGDAHRIAELTGITTIADFRRRDIAAGGQGAPLTPAFHRVAFGHWWQCHRRGQHRWNL